VAYEPFVSLSLPVPVAAGASADFTFVPFDPRAPKLSLSVPSHFGYSSAAFKRVLFDELRRNVNIAFGVVASGYFYWFASPPTDRMMTGRLFVVEVPDQKYTVAEVLVRRKGFLVDSDEVVDECVVVPVTKLIPSDDELQKSCEERFAYLWSENADDEEIPVVNEKTPDLIKDLCSFRAFKTGKRVVCEFGKDVARRINGAAIQTARVWVNPTYMKSFYGFRRNRFYRPVLEKRGVVEGELEPSLDGCLKEFCCGTVLDDGNMWTCTQCGKKVNAEKTTRIAVAPQILIVHLKRFSHTAHGTRKISCGVKYPDVLSLRDAMVGQENVVYRLYAVCEHEGEANQGHYTTHVREKDSGRWYCISDASFAVAEQDGAHNSRAYMLFYEKLE
jgi:hypothetical protein